MNFSLIKPIAGILCKDTSVLDSVLEQLEPHFGTTDIIGDWIPFDHTTYYEDEMGSDLKRAFVSFETLKAPEDAVYFKTQTAKIEDKFRVDGKRAVNIDAGYLDANKVVLVTGKHGGHKIALADGIWADFLLWYNKGWVALPWAFPDFRDGRLFPAFMKMRKKFKEQIRSL